jgi:serine/threonine-protein kinase HipA
VYKRLQKWLPEAVLLIDHSFLDSDRQKAYKELIVERVETITSGKI